MIFSLADSLPSDVSVVVSYDPLLSRGGGQDPFTSTTGVPAQPFQGQLIPNRSSDQEGPSLVWGAAVGNRLSLVFADPSGLRVADAPLTADNLYPGDVLIEAQSTDGSTRLLSAVSIALSHARRSAGSAAGAAGGAVIDCCSATRDGICRTVSVMSPFSATSPFNNTVDNQSDNRASWFQRVDLIQVVFQEIPGAGGMYLQEAAASTRPEISRFKTITSSLSKNCRCCKWT